MELVGLFLFAGFQWARDQFEGLFKVQVEASVEYLTQKDFVEKLLLNKDYGSVSLNSKFGFLTFH